MEFLVRYLNHVASAPQKLKEKKNNRKEERRNRKKNPKEMKEKGKERIKSIEKHDNTPKTVLCIPDSSSEEEDEDDIKLKSSFEINLDKTFNNIPVSENAAEEETELERNSNTLSSVSSEFIDIDIPHQPRFLNSFDDSNIYNTFEQYCEGLGFKSSEIQTIRKIFKDMCGDEIGVNVEQFNTLFGKLEYYGVRELKDTPFIPRLFYLFDKNNDGFVDEREFFRGLGIICHGDDEKKLELTFDMYDLDENGTVSKEELIELFCSTYEHKLRNLAKGSCSETKIQSFVKDFGKVFTCFVDEAFSKLDVNGDGNLSREEFKEFASNSPNITAKVNGHKDTVKMTLL